MGVYPNSVHCLEFLFAYHSYVEQRPYNYENIVIYLVFHHCFLYRKNVQVSSGTQGVLCFPFLWLHLPWSSVVFPNGHIVPEMKKSSREVNPRLCSFRFEM